jgi:hypothetical protein
MTIGLGFGSSTPPAGDGSVGAAAGATATATACESGRIVRAGRAGAGPARTTEGGGADGGSASVGVFTLSGAVRRPGRTTAPATAPASKVDATTRVIALMVPTPLADNLTRKR